jgi:PAS domain S-box-containing protein
LSTKQADEQHPLFQELKALFQTDPKIFDFIERSSLDGLWFWDLENPEHEWMSPSFWKTLGYDPAEKKHLASEWKDIIFEEDLATAFDNFEKHCANPAHPYDQFVRYRHKKGHTVWVRCRGMAIRDSSGKPIRMIGAHTDVTALKAQEAENLKQEREQKIAYQQQAMLLAELEKTANIGTWEVDLKTQEVVWSQQTKAIHEVPDDYLPNIETGINFYKEGRNRDQITAAVTAGIENGTPWDLELQIVTATGKEKWVKAQGKPYFADGECIRLFGVFQDITKQKNVEHELRAAREEAVSNSLRIQIANSSTGMGVWEWDLINDSLYWDDWMYSLYDVPKDKFSGAFEAWETSVHPDDIDHAKDLLITAIKKTGSYDTQFRILTSEGIVKHIKANALVQKDASGKSIKMIGVNYDITDKVNTMAVLKQEKSNAEAATRAKSAFLANMSHEIRTPMNAILGALQLLANSTVEASLRPVVENATLSAKGLITIINDILDYSKIESEKLMLEYAPFSALDTLDSVKYELEDLVKQKGIDFTIEVAPEFVDGWCGDSVRVKQILLNLTSNAVKFTKEGTVTVKLHSIERNDQDVLYCQIIDTGIGMSEEVQERVFERFSQADSSTTRLYGGTGLGMAISLSLVKLMDGCMHLESEEGKGTTITLELPLSRAAMKEESADKIEDSMPNLQGMKILIAEDNSINQMVIESMLTPTGASLVMVDNGKQAVDYVQQNQVDLIFMDIQMPVMDGLEAQKHIRDLNRDIPVIALTANVMSEDVARYLDAGFATHIGKPVDLKVLYQLLHIYCPTSQDN